MSPTPEPPLGQRLEGIKSRIAAASVQKAIREEAARLSGQLESLAYANFSDPFALVDWINRYCELLDCGGHLEPARIVRLFTSHGITASTNLGADYHADDPMNTAWYLAGQIVAFLETGQVHTAAMGGAVGQWFRRFDPEGNYY